MHSAAKQPKIKWSIFLFEIFLRYHYGDRDAEANKSGFLPLFSQFPGGFRSEQSSHRAPGPGSLSKIRVGTLQSWGSDYTGFLSEFLSMELLENSSIKGIILIHIEC